MNNLNLADSRILIVDDKQANIDLLHGMLTDDGFTNLKTTTDPRNVVRMFSEFKPDLILLDLLMPNLSGFQVMEQLKSMISEETYLPILVLTADINPDTKIKALESGASDFLSKPFDFIEINLRVNNLLKTRLLHQKQDNQNQILEEKVKERTAELKNTIVKLEIAKNKAEASDRLKTAFMNNISHEIRTPLNGILGFAPFIIKPNISAEEKKLYFEILNSSSTRLMNTITDMMDISLIISGNMEVHPQPTDISLLLTDIFKNFQVACKKKNLEFKIQYPQNVDNFILNTDREILRKAVSKLVDNSVKFTNEGSITLGFEQINNEIEIFVKDTGQGIGEDSQELIYKSFMQEDVSDTRGHEGNGLGLSISRGIMQLLGGKIRLESTKNIGTTVFLSLPHSSSAVTLKQKNSANDVKGGGMPLILIAEDDDSNYLYVEMLLRKDYKTLRAFDGQETVDLCRIHQDITLVLMDIKMPVMNGIEATHIIKSFRNDLPIIAVTAYARSGDEYKIREAGCDDYISKPVIQTELLSLIRKYLK